MHILGSKGGGVRLSLTPEVALGLPLGVFLSLRGLVLPLYHAHGDGTIQLLVSMLTV